MVFRAATAARTLPPAGRSVLTPGADCEQHGSDVLEGKFVGGDSRTVRFASGDQVRVL
jgi:hypothetical protein